MTQGGKDDMDDQRIAIRCCDCEAVIGYVSSELFEEAPYPVTCSGCDLDH